MVNNQVLDGLTAFTGVFFEAPIDLDAAFPICILCSCRISANGQMAIVTKNRTKYISGCGPGKSFKFFAAE